MQQICYHFPKLRCMTGRNTLCVTKFSQYPCDTAFQYTEACATLASQGIRQSGIFYIYLGSVCETFAENGPSSHCPRLNSVSFRVKQRPTAQYSASIRRID